MEERRILPSLLIFFVHIVLVSIDFVNCGFVHPVREEEYQVLLSLAAGNFATPKRERSNVEKAQSLNSGDRKDGLQQMKAEKCCCLTTKE